MVGAGHASEDRQLDALRGCVTVTTATHPSWTPRSERESDMNRKILAVKVAAVVALMVAILGALAVNAVGPCDYDDGSSPYLACYWDAQARGNGAGSSFIVIGGER